MEYRLVYVTCASKEEAESIGRTMVEERLAACANIIEGSHSIYLWRGKIEEAEETVLFLKTIAEKVPKLMERVKELHSYECPCIVILPIVGGNEDCLQWVKDSC